MRCKVQTFNVRLADKYILQQLRPVHLIQTTVWEKKRVDVMSHLVHRCEVLGLRPQAQVIQRGGERFQPAGLMPCSAYGIHSPAGLLHEVGGAKLWENLTFPHVNKNTSPKVNKKKWKQIVHAVSWPKFDCRLSVTWCVDTHQLPGFCLSSRKQITLEYLKSKVFFYYWSKSKRRLKIKAPTCCI